eukprot:16431631-Heterocapsa_arctica.AAC.1
MKLQAKIARHHRQHPRLAEEAQELDRYHDYLVMVTTEERRETLLQQLDVRLLPEPKGTTVAEEQPEEEVAEREMKTVVDQLGSLEEPAVEGPYIVSYTAKRKFARLHLLRGCWRRPGRDLKCFSTHATLKDVHYDSYCRDCWGKGPGGTLTIVPTLGAS